MDPLSAAGISKRFRFFHPWGGSSRAPRVNSPAVPGGMGQGLPSALSSIWGRLHPLGGVTALPSAEPLSHGWGTRGIGASEASPGGAAPAAASCQAEGTGRRRQSAGSCREAGAWQCRRGGERRHLPPSPGPPRTLERRLCPCSFPASPPEQQTSTVGRPGPGSIGSLAGSPLPGWRVPARAGSRVHGGDRPCRGSRIRVKPNSAT